MISALQHCRTLLLHSLSSVHSHSHASNASSTCGCSNFFTWRWSRVIWATRQLLKSFFCLRNLQVEIFTLLLSLKFIRKTILDDYLLFSFLSSLLFVCFFRLVHRKPNVNCLSKHIFFFSSLFFVVLLVLCPSIVYIVLRKLHNLFLHWNFGAFVLITSG